MPGKVLVGAASYLVTQDPGQWLAIEHKLQRKGDYGHADSITAMIHINPDCSPDVARLTLWHEVLHCLCETVMGAPDWRDLGTDREEREESVVRSLESPTLLVLRDNPDLTAYLLS